MCGGGLIDIDCPPYSPAWSLSPPSLFFLLSILLLPLFPSFLPPISFLFPFFPSSLLPPSLPPPSFLPPHLPPSSPSFKNEKLLLLLTNTELLHEEFLTCVYEFVKEGAISPLFSKEERSHIVNAIRSDLTRTGLEFSHETAWKFFIE